MSGGVLDCFSFTRRDLESGRWNSQEQVIFGSLGTKALGLFFPLFQLFFSFCDLEINDQF